MEVKAYIAKIMEKDEEYGIEKLMDAFDTLICDLKDENPELYEKNVYKLESLAYYISMSDAQDIVNNMKPYGEHWAYETVKQVLESHNINKHFIEYYLVMNMFYNDYHDVAANYNLQESVDFFFQMSYAFINDIDAKPFKVEKYFL